MNPTAPSTVTERDALRAVAGAILAQQSELSERECGIRERETQLAGQETQIAERLDEQQTRLRELQDQLHAGREEYRAERQRAGEMLAEAERSHLEAMAERRRLRELRPRFIARLRRHWQAERREAERRRREVEAANRAATTVTDHLRLEREELERERTQFNSERAAFRLERDAFERSRQQIDVEQRRRGAELAEVERRASGLRAEARGLELRVAAARRVLAAVPAHLELPAPVVVNASAEAGTSQHQLRTHLAALTDQRSHLAEMCSRLTGAESHWQREQLEAIGEMEQFAFEIQGRDEQSRQRSQELDRLADRLRQERDALTNARINAERRESEAALRQSAWAGERNLRRAELDDAERRISRREAALESLFDRWRKRRGQEVEQIREMTRLGHAARVRWTEQRDEYHRRSESLRVGQQALAEQALALEEVRQEFLANVDRPERASRHLERLRRRWQGLTAASRRDVDALRDRLAAEDSQLRAIYLELEKEKEVFVRRERELSQQRTELENEQRRAALAVSDLDSARRAWAEQRREYDLMLVDLRAELDRPGRGQVPPQLRAA